MGERSLRRIGKRGNEESVIAVEEVIVLDERIRRVGEEEV